MTTATESRPTVVADGTMVAAGTRSEITYSAEPAPVPDGWPEDIYRAFERGEISFRRALRLRADR